MLPKNKLRKFRLDRLKVFQGDVNPYEANLVKRYDLSPDGTWAGRGAVPAATTEKQSGTFEHAKKVAGWA